MTVSPILRSLKRWLDARGWSQIIIGVPSLWLAAFFIFPFVIIVMISLGAAATSSPPFRYLADFPFTDLGSYSRLLGNGLVLDAFFNSAVNALVATLLCLLIGYPMALGITRLHGGARTLILLLVILPFWTSFLLRVYAWMGLLRSSSWLNKMLTSIWNFVTLGNWEILSLQLMNTTFAVNLVMVYSYLPFMILPLYANLAKLDRILDEAAMDLGSRPARVFWDVTLPLSMPGIIAGSMLVFIPASGELVIPTLVGNSSQPMIGRVISDQFSVARDWPFAAAISVALLCVLLVLMGCFSRMQSLSDRKEGSV
ncbi:ABC transporter permease [Thioclava kandeliae]|uniref:ABC transporter permease n=1 Tax=Thioclava kandeliae TaxID=3070818 RepID=A0ABV1SLL6_9RHOB